MNLKYNLANNTKSKEKLNILMILFYINILGLFSLSIIKTKENYYF